MNGYCGGENEKMKNNNKQYNRLKETCLDFIRIPITVKNEFLEYSNKVNLSTTIILCFTMIMIEIMNMSRVLFFTTTKLATLNNCIYFSLYFILFISAIFILILLYKFKNKPIALSRIYTFVALFWLTWNVVFNSYELQGSSENSIFIFITAIFGIAIFFSLKPMTLIIIYGITNVLFLIFCHTLVNSGILINLSISILVALFASFTRFRHVTTELIQQKEINEFNQQLTTEQEKLRISLEKHEIVMRQSNDVMFEWDMRKDCLIFSQTWFVKYQMPLIIENAESWLKNDLDIVEIETLTELMKQCKEGLPYIEYDFRTVSKEETIHWYRVRISMQYDENALPFKGIGILLDIDEQKKKINELTSLLKKDPLTGILNKVAFGEKVKACLSELPVEQSLAMMMMDLDGFRDINDQFGHPYGDYVLVEFASCMKRVFGEAALLGRIGGDEFSVVYSSIHNLNDISDKANEFLETINTYHWKKTKLTLHCSIGISVTNQNKKSFEQLYQEADSALYQVKRTNKGHFSYYQE